MDGTTPEQPSILPQSPLFSVQQTPHAGRAVFATTTIPANATIWTSADLTLSVLLREYRREVCAQCFNYEHGRDLKLQDRDVGFAFCNAECQSTWRLENGELGISAWKAVERLVKGRGKEDDSMVAEDLPRPEPGEIERAWESVGVQARLIRIARQGEVCSTTGSKEDTGINGANGTLETNGPNTELKEPIQITKQHKKALAKALSNRISPDILNFCVSGLLTFHNSPHKYLPFLSLAANPTPYPQTEDLQSFTRSYLHLLAILPPPLLPHLTPQFLISLSARDSHNAFGIRSLEDEGSEFFGYGVWPKASYFNHSCSPNLVKVRVGRCWEFRIREGMEVKRGEELCICYLGREQRGWGVRERRRVMRRDWGFECKCARCCEEAGEA